MHDLKEIRRSPLQYVSAQPLEDNILVWHGNLLGPENTPYAGAVFHIQLTFPETYPTTPPSATIMTDLPHPHVRGNKICLDLLSDFQSYFSGSDSGTRTEGIKGWSSAYSVQTILLQLQTFLMELKPEEEGQPLHQYLSKIPAAIKKSREFACTVCGHTASSPWPPLGVRIHECYLLLQNVIMIVK
jgi:ubiquitin-protein ligase